MDTVQSIQRAIRAWRGAHRRGPLPVDLRRRVVAACEGLDDAEARRAFGVRAETLRRWRSRPGAARPEKASSPTFTVLEVAPRREGAPEVRGEVRVMIFAGDGRTIQIAGALGAEDLATIVRGCVG